MTLHFEVCASYGFASAAGLDRAKRELAELRDAIRSYHGVEVPLDLPEDAVTTHGEEGLTVECRCELSVRIQGAYRSPEQDLISRWGYAVQALRALAQGANTGTGEVVIPLWSELRRVHPGGRIEHVIDDSPPELVRRLSDPRLRQRGDLGGVACSPDGRFLVTASLSFSSPGTLHKAMWTPPNSTRRGSAEVVLWDATSNDRLEVLHQGFVGVRDVVFRPDGRALALAAFEGAFVLELSKDANQLTCVHRDPGFNTQELAFSRSGRFLAIRSTKGVWLWDAEAQHCHEVYPCQYTVEAILFTPDDLLVILDAYQVLRFWDSSSRELAFEGPEPRGRDRLALCRGGRFLALLSTRYPDDPLFFDLRRRQEVPELPADEDGSDDPDPAMWAALSGATLHPDGERAVRVEGSRARWVAVPTGTPLDDCGHSRAIQALCFPARDELVSSSSDGTVRRWSVGSGEELACWVLPGDYARQLAVLSEETLIGWGRETLWLFERGVDQPRTLPAPPDADRLLDACPRGEILAFEVGGRVQLVRSDGQLGATVVELEHLRSARFISPDRLVICHDESVTLVDSRGQVVGTRVVGDYPITARGSEPDRIAVVSSFDRECWVLRGDELEVLEHRELGKRPVWMKRLAPGGQLAAGFREHQLALYDIGTAPEDEGPCPLIFLRPAHPDHVVALAFSPDGALLASGSNHGMIAVWRCSSWPATSSP